MGKWQTSIKEKSDANGLVNSRGHLGKYEISVIYGGKTVKMDYRLTEESAIVVVKF